MANTKSAQKRIRVAERKRLRNRLQRGKARAALKSARQALEAGDVVAAREAVRSAEKALDHAASKGVLHQRNAGRRKGRLMKQLAQLEAQGK